MSTSSDNEHTDDITDALGSDPAAVHERSGKSGKMLIKALDHVVKMQASSITNYVNWLRKRNPEASPSDIQKMLDKHVTYLATGSGASAGAAAAVPGIGFITGAAAVGAESLVFLDAAAFYTMASAYLRGADISDPERRKALILVVVMGSSGTALVDAAVGDLGVDGGNSTISTLSRFSGPSMSKMNNRLLKQALKQTNKRLRAAWIGKVMPLGIGAVIGTVANRKLAKKLIGNTYDSLGPAPAEFPSALPAVDEIKDQDIAELDKEVTEAVEHAHQKEGVAARSWERITSTAGTVGGGVASAARGVAGGVSGTVRKLPFVPKKKDATDGKA
ncbi:hypothetical protein CCICO_04535 [Corynebacterium ciconiae DSM 44920]|nr:hypothetical protein [Corynebacterium ciconiae]WKD60944.1 hypothetical protein CCICO_04535 [Corynebacterium ciconiae DSM 44920]